MGVEDHEWRERVLAAAERAAAALRPLHDPHLTDLLEDLERLRTELGGGEAQASTEPQLQRRA